MVDKVGRVRKLVYYCLFQDRYLHITIYLLPSYELEVISVR